MYTLHTGLQTAAERSTHLACEPEIGIITFPEFLAHNESRLFLLGANRLWGFPLFLLLAITACEGPENYFCHAIKAFGAFELIVPKYCYGLRKMKRRNLDSLI